MTATFRKAFSLLAVLAVSACATGEPASRSASIGEIQLSTSTGAGAGYAAVPSGVTVLASRYAVAEMRVDVPRSLTVSEANSFLPKADIVWRGEPRADRHAQVARIFNDGMLAGTEGMARGTAVIVEVEVTRFHCLTEKARFTVGGNHAIDFVLTVRDAATGAVLDGPRPVIADVKAAGGAAALAEDQSGRTQRVVVVERIAEVIRRELSGPAALPTGMPGVQAALAGPPQSSSLVTRTGL